MLTRNGRLTLQRAFYPESAGRGIGLLAGTRRLEKRGAMVTGTPWRHGLSLADAAPDFCCARTEAPGRADLRACALVQLLPMLLIPLMMLLCRERSDLGRYRGWMIAFTITAKRLEFFDNAIFAAGGIVSGHSVKHLFAAMAPASLLYGLRQRRYHAARRPTL